MKVSLKNVGMLDEAEFEVGDLTIICGENNTGKTYATYSLYGYLDFIENNANYILFNMLEDIVEEDLEICISDEHIVKITQKNMENIIIKLFSELEQEYRKKLALTLAGRENDFVTSSFHTNAKDTILQYINNIDNENFRDKIKDFFSNTSQFELLGIIEQYIVFSFEKFNNKINQITQKDVAYEKKDYMAMILN